VPQTPSAVVKNSVASQHDTYSGADLTDAVRAALMHATLAAESERQAEHEPRPHVAS